MSMSPRPAILALALFGLSALGLILACGGTGSSASPAAQPQMGTVTTILTDAPSDAWSAVEVAVQSVEFRSKADATRTVVGLKGNSSRINLVELDEVGELLGHLTIPVGTYDAVILQVDTDPANLKLVRQDGSHVPTSQLRVLGSGRILVKLDQDLVVTANGTSQVQIDFNLANPVFLVDLADGSVMVNLSAPGLLRHQGLPAIQQVEFRRAQGTVQAVNPDRLKMRTALGGDLELTLSAASTWIYNVDAKAMGSFADLAPGKPVAVFINLEADGSLFARRIWYSADAAKLPDWSPEGHVVKVDVANSRLTVLGASGLPVDYAVNAATTFTWHTSVALGSGATGLPRMQRGFKVGLVVVDATATPKVLQTVNVQKAVDEDLFSAVSQASFTLGTTTPRTYAYRTSPAFSWWPLADPMSASTVLPDFVAAAQVGLAQGRARGYAGLAWGGTDWKAAWGILLPVALPGKPSVVSYSPANSELKVSCLKTDGTTVPYTLTLSNTAPVTTGLWDLNLSNGLVTFTQVPTSAWAELLVPGHALSGTYVPMQDGSLKAYTLILKP